MPEVADDTMLEQPEPNDTIEASKIVVSKTGGRPQLRSNDLECNFDTLT